MTLVVFANEEIIKKMGLEKDDYFKAVGPFLASALKAYTSIRLRLNPEEKNKKLQAFNDAVLTDLETIRTHVKLGRNSEARESMQQLSNNSINVLKEEWKRVKSGELIYRISKWTASGIILVAVLLGILALVNGSKKDVAPGNFGLELERHQNEHEGGQNSSHEEAD